MCDYLLDARLGGDRIPSKDRGLAYGEYRRKRVYALDTSSYSNRIAVCGNRCRHYLPISLQGCYYWEVQWW